MPFDLSFACPDWEAKLRRGETPIADLPLNADRARHAVHLFDGLRLPDVKGHPPLSEAAGEWFRDIVRYAFAAEHPDTCLPLINEVFCLVPKKNSKTTYSAALGLTALMLWDLPNAQMLILGPTQNVAERCFGQAAGMINADPRLKAIFHVQAHLKTITRWKTGATLSVKTFDLNVVTGEIPALTIIDELHVVASRSYAARVVAQITGGTVTNASALVVYITTQSDVPPVGVFKTKLDYARGVRDGTITGDVRMLPVLYEFPVAMQVAEDKPWRDPAHWPMVLPNLGRSIQPQILASLYAAAVEEGIESEIVWASQHLNIEIGLGLHGDRWAGALYWPQAAMVARGDARPIRLDDMMAEGDVAVAGVDGGGLDDLYALAAIIRHRESRDWMHWTHAWAQPEVFERRKLIASALRGFEDDGDLTVCAEVNQDAAEAAEICARLRDAGLLPEAEGIGLDMYGIATTIEALAARGIGEPQVTGVKQGYGLQMPILTVPRKLKDRTFRHANQRIMAWAVGNAKQGLKGSNVEITKAAAGPAKIDPLMATLNAAFLMFMNPVASGGPSVYRERGMLVI